ncbi:MAG: serine O-acetyltransferase [Proteobacteria bacterium]|jgi:serine O-acetyltransferase|nr:serine O-acetyltransferase [Pseudomonadota bacterium]
MEKLNLRVQDIDPVWKKISFEAEKALKKELFLGALIHSSILNHNCLDDCLSYRISQKLASGDMSEQSIRELSDKAFSHDISLSESARCDLMAVIQRDPACHDFLQPILYFKGFLALQAYRLSHWLWQEKRFGLSYFIQSRVSEVFGIDIHPAAIVGKGIMIDHAHSIVIGETAIVGNNVSMLHSVTLGGTGKGKGKRHPTIEDGVLLGAGAKVLGDITIGHCSRVAAGSVVLKSVPAKKTVAGVPAKIVGEAGCSNPAISMDQLLSN